MREKAEEETGEMAKCEKSMVKKKKLSLLSLKCSTTFVRLCGDFLEVLGGLLDSMKGEKASC